MMGHPTRPLARTAALAALLALLLGGLVPLPPATAAGHRAQQPVQASAPQVTADDTTGCLIVKASLTAADGPSAPAGGWTVTLTGAATAEAQTDAAGIAQFSALPAGTYTVTQLVPYPYGALAPVAVEVEPASAGTGCALVEFQAEQVLTGCIDGAAVDEAGVPLAGQRIYAQPADAGAPAILTLTDADGSFFFPALAPGAWTVRHDLPPGWTALTPAEVAVTVAPAAALEGCLPVSFRARPPALCIEGALTDAIANAGVPGVSVTATLASGGAITTTQTDAAGRFRFEALAPGEYTRQRHHPARLRPRRSAQRHPHPRRRRTLLRRAVLAALRRRTRRSRREGRRRARRTGRRADRRACPAHR